jgi:hypothetical protein
VSSEITSLYNNIKGIWIPKEIWFNEELSIGEKILFIQIDNLDNESGCTASNSYFAGFMSLSKERVSELIKSLEVKGYIRSRIERFQTLEGIKTKRTLRSCVKIAMVKDPFMLEDLNKRQNIPSSENRIPPLENGMTPSGNRFAHSENHPYINIPNNININKDILEFWNSKEIIKHKDYPDKLDKLIKKSGYSKEDILHSITNYSLVLKDTESFFNYKWTLCEFISRGVEKFLDDVSLTNFKKVKPKEELQTDTLEERNEARKKRDEMLKKIEEKNK